MESAVRNQMLARALSASLIASSALGFAQTQALGAIESVQGKRYKLAPEHGPWMIMVTSLWGSSKEQLDRAVKAADDLVYELRKKGIPAYVYTQDSQIERIATVDRQGRESRRIFAAQRGMVGVLAGNYESVDDSKAQKTLKYVKNFQPQVLKTAGYVGTASGQGPLAQAFLTRNPLLTPEEAASKTRDPLLVRLNGNQEYSLLQNKGKYTVVVASFYGNSTAKPREFDKFAARLSTHSTLDSAGLESWQLVKTMRQQNIEAYVYHDRFKSVVTVGAFNSPQDPQIGKLIKMFSAKVKKSPQTGEEVLIAESIQIPGAREGAPPTKMWAMDPEPKVMDVPHWR